MTALRAFAELVPADGERIYFDAYVGISESDVESRVAARLARVPTIRAYVIKRATLVRRKKPIADIQTIIEFVGPARDMAGGWR